jgi:hypothetical protein
MRDHFSYDGDADGAREFLEFLVHLLRKEEFDMAQVQFSATFNVTGGTSSLTVTPASGTFNLTVGTPADGTAVCVVSGGQAPYSYALDPASGPMPTGVTFAEDANGNVTLAGTPSVAGTSSSPVLLDITDAAGASAQVKGRFNLIR